MADRLLALSESETLAMARRSREMQAQGIDIVSLSLGEPDYDTPDFIKEAAKKAIDDNFTHYPPVSGYPELKAVISEKFKRDNNLNYSPEQIVVSTGAKQSLANIILALINPGDEVILLSPYWVSYVEMVKLAGGTPVTVYSGIEKDYKVSAGDIEAHINDNTRLLIFSSPCNPTGSVFSYNELKDMAQMLARYPNVVVVSDEIYEHIQFEHEHISIGIFPEISDRVVTVNGLSKSFAMTGWRLGYIGAPTWIAKACDKFQGQITSGACTISQRAAIAALKADKSTIAYMVEGFRKRRALMYDYLKNIEGLKVNMPQGAFYFFPDVSAYLGKTTAQGGVIKTPGDLTMYLLNEYKVATVSGEAFGCSSSLRLSYALSEPDIHKAMERFKSGLEALLK